MARLIVHIVHGKDTDSANKAVQDLKRQALAGHPSELHGLLVSEFDLETQPIEHIHAEPFLAVQNQKLLGVAVVIWRNADALLAVKDKEALWFPVRAINNAAENVVLIVQFRSFPEMSTVGLSLNHAVAQSGKSTVQEFDQVAQFDRQGKRDLIARVAVDAGIADRLDPAAAKELAAMISGDTLQVRTLMGQLRDSTSERTIGLADVRKLAAQSSTSVWELCDAIVAGNHAAAVRAVQQLHRRGELKSIRAVQSAISYCIRQAAMVICAPSDRHRAADAWGVKLSPAKENRLQESGCTPARVFAMWQVMTDWEAQALDGQEPDALRTAELLSNCALL